MTLSSWLGGDQAIRSATCASRAARQDRSGAKPGTIQAVLGRCHLLAGGEKPDGSQTEARRGQPEELDRADRRHRPLCNRWPTPTIRWRTRSTRGPPSTATTTASGRGMAASASPALWWATRRTGGSGHLLFYSPIAVV